MGPVATAEHAFFGQASGLYADIDRHLSEVDRRLQPYLQQAMGRVQDVDCLKEGVVFQALGGGKRIRAAMCTTVCEIFCGSYLPALNFAAAIEHLQNFTLIHDDIADGDDQRRGETSAWKRFGLAHAINIGDIFIPLGSLAILEADYSDHIKVQLLRILSELGLQVAAGQSLDINLRRNNAPTAKDYVECTSKKTGSFFAMAAVGGGLIGGASECHLESLKAFASQAGVAFQIKDDVLDVVGGKGRAPGSDVLEGKRTLLVAYAFQRAGQEGRRQLFEILNRPRRDKTASDVAWVHELFFRTHARERAEQLADDLIDEALRHLLDLPETPAKYRFLRLSKYLTRRVH